MSAALAAALFAGAAASVLARTRALTLPTDDAYIYLGYVKMLFTHGGGLFSYNIGEHSAGTTGLAFYYLLSLASLPITLVTRQAPTPAQLELVSWLSSFACTVVLAVLFCGLVAESCREQEVTRRRDQLLCCFFALCMLFSHPRLLWGLFSGMENPLAALCVLAFAAATARPARWLKRGATAAGVLAATRPEWLPLVAIWPVVIAGRGASDRSKRQALVVRYAVMLLVLGVCFVPLRVVSGQWQPEAYGARAHLTLGRMLKPDIHGLASVFAHDWTLWLVAGLLVGAAARRWLKSPTALTGPLIVACFFVMRGMFKLTDFNIRDRYVSYLWPLLVLPWVPVVVGVARNLSQVAASPSRGWARGARLGAACLCCAIVGAAAVGCRSSFRAAVADAQRMREIVREPSQWMNEHLPSQSIVSMEPAGAIRVFTPFTLVDRTGLTTTQAGAFRARVGQYAADDYDAFVTMYQVEYALDYPEFMDSGSNLAREIRRWDATEMRDAPPRICLYRIGTGARSR